MCRYGIINIDDEHAPEMMEGCLLYTSVSSGKEFVPMEKERDNNGYNRRKPKKKVCQFCADKSASIDYKDTAKPVSYTHLGLQLHVCKIPKAFYAERNEKPCRFLRSGFGHGQNRDIRFLLFAESFQF